MSTLAEVVRKKFDMNRENWNGSGGQADARLLPLEGAPAAAAAQRGR